MAQAAFVYNMKCLKCDCIEIEMVKVGPMVFCNDCFSVEFVDEGLAIPSKKSNGKDEIDSGSEGYKTWLETYKKCHW